MNPKELWLLQQFNAGSKQAFEDVYRMYFTTVYHHVQNLLRNDVNARTVTAEVFEKLWRIRKQLNTLPNLKAYLLKSARNTSLHFLDQTAAEPPMKARFGQGLPWLMENQFNQEVERVVVGMLLREKEQWPVSAKKFSA